MYVVTIKDETGDMVQMAEHERLLDATINMTEWAGRLQLGWMITLKHLGI